MASVTASVSIPAAPDRVWAVLADVANASRWNRAWQQIEMMTELTQGRGTRFRAHAPADDGDERGPAFEFEITEWIAPEYIVFTPLRTPTERRYEITLDYHAFRLVPEDAENTRVELTAHATARGVRGRVVGLFFWPGHQKAGLEEALKSLAAVFGVTADNSS